MPGYADTKKLIEDTLVNRPAGTVIVPEDHQTFALSMLDYIHAVELLGASSLQGSATVDTVPVQPLNSRVSYISSVPPGQTYVYTNFLDENGHAISVTSGANTVSLLTLLWNGTYWTVSVIPLTLAIGYTDGYLFKGIAVPTDNPGTPDQNVFYIASQTGTYTNFGGLAVADGEVAILRYNGSWAKEITGAATAEEVTRLQAKVDNKLPVFVPSIQEGVVLSYDTTTKTLTIPKDTIIKTKSGYKSNASDVTLQIPSNYTSAVLIIYDESNDEYSYIPYNWTPTKNQYVIAGLRTVRGEFSTSLPWSVNGKRYGISVPVIPEVEKELLLYGVPSLNYGTYCNFDTTANTFTIPQDTVIRYGKNYYALPSEIVVDISASVIGTSAILVVFDTTTKEFSAIYYSATIPEGKRVFACIRRSTSNPGVSCVFPWSINGNPYGIVIPKTENRRGYTRGVNHRGYNSTAPENTIPAFRLSREKGFKTVECDVRFTSDGVPVILHDVSINRTARNADGTAISTTVNIEDITYEQALTYDFGIWKGDVYAGTKIPTFEQVISLCRNLGLDVYIELKAGTQAQVENLVKIVRQYGMSNNVSWISFTLSLLTYVKDYSPKARLGYLATPTENNLTSIATLNTQDNEVFFDSSVYGQTEIDLCKAAGIPLEVWTINSQSTIIGLDAFISGVTSDTQDASTLLLP